MRISDWSSDVCSSDLAEDDDRKALAQPLPAAMVLEGGGDLARDRCRFGQGGLFEFRRQFLLDEVYRGLEMGQHPRQPRRPAAGETRQAASHLPNRKSTRLNSSH